MANETTDGVLRLITEQARQQIAEVKGMGMVEMRPCYFSPESDMWLESPILCDKMQPCYNSRGDRQSPYWQVVPDWPANIAAAWPLFEEMATDAFGACPYLNAAIGLRPNPEFGAEVMVYALRHLSALTICAAWLSWKLDRPVEIMDETEAGE